MRLAYTGAVEGTIDLLTVLVRSGSCDLSLPGVAQAYSMVTALAGADGLEGCSPDHAVLQNAAMCVRAFIQTMPEQVCALDIQGGGGGGGEGGVGGVTGGCSSPLDVVVAGVNNM